MIGIETANSNDGYIGEVWLIRAVCVRLWRYDVVGSGRLWYLWAVGVEDGLPYPDWPRWDGHPWLVGALWNIVKHSWQAFWRRQPDRGGQSAPSDNRPWHDNWGRERRPTHHEVDIKGLSACPQCGQDLTVGPDGSAS